MTLDGSLVQHYMHVLLENLVADKLAGGGY